MAGPFDDAFASPFDSPFGGGAARRQPPSYRRPLTPAEQVPIQKTLLNHGASGLQYALSSLDKPGRAVRGVIAGKPDEALAAIPFSDSLGITNPERATTGRDITNQLGITAKHDKGWGAWGAGLAAEMALDPLTYATFGARHALTGAGKALQQTGHLKGWSGRAMLEGFHALEPELIAGGKTASEIEHLRNMGQRIASPEAVAAAAKAGSPLRAGMPLSGHVGIGLPFSTPSAFIGQGPFAQKVAGALGQAGDTLRYGNKVGRAVGALFDPNVGGAVDAITQRGMARYGTPALQAGQAVARGEHYNLIQKLNDLLPGSPYTAEEIASGVRSAAEGVPMNHVPGGLAGEVGPAAGAFRSPGQRQITEAQQIGLPVESLIDPFVEYGPRHSAAHGANATQIRQDNLFPVYSGSNIQRKDPLRGIPGGTEALQRWSIDPELSGRDRLLGNKAAANKILGDMLRDAGAAGINVTQDLHNELVDKSAQVANYLKKLAPEHAADAKPLFSQNLPQDLLLRGKQHARTMAAAEAALGTIGDVARPMADGNIPVHVLLRKLGLTTTRADVAAGIPAQGALVEAYKRLAKQGAGNVDKFLMDDKLRGLRNAVGQFGVSPEHAAQILKGYARWVTPEQMKAPLGFLDSATNAFKNLAYPLWPASHVRNLTSALMTNLNDSTLPRAYAQQFKLMRDTLTADEIRRFMPTLPAGLNDQQAREWLRGQQYASGKIFGGHNGATDLAGGTAAGLNPEIIPPLPGSGRTGPTGNFAGDLANLVGREGLGETARELIEARGNPLRAFQMERVGNGTKDFAALRAGRQVGSNIEDFVRGAHWLSAVQQGADPLVAAQRMNKVHFDYDQLTNFEKTWMRRLVPFYTFQSRNLPLQAERALTRPGMITSQLRPIGTSPDQYTPEYLASGVAIPNGPENANGNQQFISQLGLPVEEALERLKFEGGLPDWRKTALAYGAGLNPLIKGPLEQLFNTQFYSGRKLSDLKPPAAATLGGLLDEETAQPVAQALLNTPLTRFITSAEKLRDPRKSALAKAANLLTGVRVTDVDMNKMRAIEARNALTSLMERHPNISQFTDFYVRPEDVAKLSPEEVELMRAWATAQQNAQQYAKQKRQRIGVASR